MIPDRYAWLVWTAAFLIPWLTLYLAFPQHRRTMVLASVLTTSFGLTEPLFVPEYWDPPSLFNLAQRTGFDIESLIFCFGIGGVGAVLVNVLSRRVVVPLPDETRHDQRHRFHRWVLASPFLVFVALLPLPFNPIYPAIAAMLVGATLTVWCRPDLARSVALGAGVFLVYYAVLLAALELSAPGYVDRVWNLEALSGLRVGFAPVEELLFAIGFGGYWAGVYEHLTWGHAVAAAPRVTHAATAAAHLTRGGEVT